MKAGKSYYKAKSFLCLAGAVILMSIFMFFYFKADLKAYLGDKYKPNKGQQHLTLIENVELSPQWKEIDLTGANFARKELNQIIIAVNPPYTVVLGKNSGIRAPDGESFLPEVAVENRDGKRCHLRFSGSTGEHAATFWDSNTETRCFSEPRKYKTLLVRSPVSIKVRKILWSGFDVKDLK